LKFGLSNHSTIIRQIVGGTNFLAGIKILAIDPAFDVTTLFIEKLRKVNEIYNLPVAVLPHDVEQNFKLVRFYLSENSLSSSLFSQSSSKKGDQIVPGMKFSEILQSTLNGEVMKEPESIIIRMNCEGSEMAIIKDLLDGGWKAELILGSLGDIGKKFNAELQDRAFELLENNEIIFQDFKGSDPSTWPFALRYFKNN